MECRIHHANAFRSPYTEVNIAGRIHVTAMQKDNQAVDQSRVGLCYSCLHSKVLESNRGSKFYLCQLALSDPGRFAKYPRLPVLCCAGYESSSSAKPTSGRNDE